MTSDSSNALRFLPVGLDVQDENCLVVGGGDVGTRKAITLARAGAMVTVVSPTRTRKLAEQTRADNIHWVNDSFRKEHLRGVFLAVAATDDEALNATVVRLATQYGVLVCDASSAERSQVIFGALLEGDDVTIAVFTGGRDPAEAGRTRDQIAKLLARGRKSEPQP
ncbi:MAG: hypothetical protein GTO22_26260 [Gemmatimonadales bacterium]|nr:hypothetical protein [Gemmatimonadales bacterium]